MAAKPIPTASLTRRTESGLFIASFVGEPGDSYYFDTSSLVRPGTTNNGEFTYQSIGGAVNISGTIQPPADVIADPINTGVWSTPVAVASGAFADSGRLYSVLRITWASKALVHIAVS